MASFVILLCFRAVVFFLQVHRPSRLCIGRGVGRPSVCLGGLVGRRPISVPALFASGSVPSGLLQTCTPQFSLLLGTSTVVFRALLRDSDSRSSRRSRLSVYLPFPRLPSTETPRICISGPFRGCPTRTAAIFGCVVSFIQVVTAKYRMPNLSPVTRSRYTPHRSGHSLSS